MTSLAQKIKIIYPSLVDDDFSPKIGTILIRDESNGKGEYIQSWTNINPKPTQEQLNAIN